MFENISRNYLTFQQNQHIHILPQFHPKVSHSHLIDPPRQKVLAAMKKAKLPSPLTSRQTHHQFTTSIIPITAPSSPTVAVARPIKKMTTAKHKIQLITKTERKKSVPQSLSDLVYKHTKKRVKNHGKLTLRLFIVNIQLISIA